MKSFYHVLIVLTVFLLLIQQILSGCAMKASKGINNEDARLSDRYVFQDKCSKCHELPDIEAYPYSSDDWAKVVDFMIETKEAEQYISMEEAEDIKSFLRRHSIINHPPLFNEK
ncbi:MAG: hypothetical protein SCARUB_03132 [Candidatus Scalindua rubra]|uniref:Cytochrome c domain-containing protein n=1 Tax=Candidatus Scalindua rubra TaxID=1872076 RepID=A0A1E3X7X8_9BACT|nr:MAG: hypothetical protein SCARUB_03132 [Candidatus Scalindua rubra]